MNHRVYSDKYKSLDGQFCCLLKVFKYIFSISFHLTLVYLCLFSSLLARSVCVCAYVSSFLFIPTVCLRLPSFLLTRLCVSALTILPVYPPLCVCASFLPALPISCVCVYLPFCLPHHRLSTLTFLPSYLQFLLSYPPPHFVYMFSFIPQITPLSFKPSSSHINYLLPVLLTCLCQRVPDCLSVCVFPALS